MSKQAYWQKLKDPRWQKKRLEVLSHYEFRCQKCADEHSPLHVHHKEYFKGHEPWDYETGQMTVLCESCHESEHMYKDAYKYVGSFLDMDGPNNRNTIAFIVAGYTGFDYESLLKEVDYEDCPFTRAFYALGVKMSTVEIRFSDYADSDESGGKNER